jgi:hypothetical protein
LELIAWDRIERYRPIWRNDPAEVETAFAYLLASGAERDQFEEYLRQNCSDIEEIWRSYLELMERAPGQQVKPPQKGRNNTEAEIRALIESDRENATHLVSLGDVLRRDPRRAAEAESAFRSAIDMDPSSRRRGPALVAC